MSICNICPRACKIERKRSASDRGTVGYCASGMLPVISRAALHHWEEPCIAGTRGAGTVFFAGCNLSCVYCQNYEISEMRKGIEVSVDRLKEIYQELIRQGAHNIDLVTPTHYTHAIFQSLRDPLPVPVVYNCGGYESVHTVAFLRNKVQCWLPDLKYMDSKASKRYSDAPDYFEKASAAIEQMFRQTGPYEIGPDGILKKGVLIRHLILPGQVEDTKRIMEYIAETFAPATSSSASCASTFHTEEPANSPKSTGESQTKNMRNAKATWKTSASPTATSGQRKLRQSLHPHLRRHRGPGKRPRRPRPEIT